jgi:hypothetical protein
VSRVIGYVGHAVFQECAVFKDWRGAALVVRMRCMMTGGGEATRREVEMM